VAGPSVTESPAIATERTGFLIGSAVLVIIGVTVIALAPAKPSGEQSAATVA